MLRSVTELVIKSLIIKENFYKVHSRSINYSALSHVMPPTTLVALQEEGGCQECQHNPERHDYR